MKRDNAEAHAQLERELDAALARLAGVAPPPLLARTQLMAAKRRRAHRAPRVTRFERYEPRLLWTLSAVHLVWLMERILAGG